jgi:hypothetical protein
MEAQPREIIEEVQRIEFKGASDEKEVPQYDEKHSAKQARRDLGATRGS